MPEPTTDVFSTAGLSFKIGSTAISNCYSTPDMGSDPEQIDVTSFDDTVNKHYIPGLQDVQKLNFDFYNKQSNFNAAVTAEPSAGATATYTITYPSGLVYTITGSHKTYALATAPNEAEKFRISVSVATITRTPAT